MYSSGPPQSEAAIQFNPCLASIQTQIHQNTTVRKKNNSRCAIKACLFFFHPLWATLQLNFHILFILCLSIVHP